MNLINRLRSYFQAVHLDTTIDVLPLDFAFASTETQTHKPLLTCTFDTFRPAPRMLGLNFVVLSQHSDLTDILEGLDTNEQGFDPTALPTTIEQACTFRQELVTGRAFTAKMGGQPVAAGMLTSPHNSIAELAGMTTLLAYRNHGIGAALTSEVVRVAFEQGVEILVLWTDNPIAYRLYQRVGFRVAAILRSAD